MLKYGVLVAACYAWSVRRVLKSSYRENLLGPGNNITSISVLHALLS